MTDELDPRTEARIDARVAELVAGWPPLGERQRRAITQFYAQVVARTAP